MQRYLEEPAHRAKLEGRAAYRRGNCEWWRYTWPLHRERYRGPRLISPYLLALLNSRLMTFRFRGLAKLTGRNMWEAFDSSIAPLPIRRIDFDHSVDREGHDELVELVRRAEDAVKTVRTGQAASERTLAGRQVDGLAKRLEDLVLDLYGIRDPETRQRILDDGAPL